MKSLKTIALLLAIVLVFSGAMFGLNFITGPVIEANNAGAVFAPLLAVMPEGAAFGGDALIYSAADAAASALKDVPASVVAVYKEANGLGYAISCTAESQYSTAPMKITLGISAEGKISGVQIDEYNDTASFDFRAKDPTYLEGYLGKDSALADIGTVAGSTFSSTAFKNAITEAMGVLIANDMIAEGKKSDDQVLTELIATVAPGFVKLEEETASGNIVKALKPENDAGYAYIMTEADASYLAVVSASNFCKIFDVTGADVTDDHAALVEEAQIAAAAEQKDYVEALVKKLGNMMDGAEDFVSVQPETFNTVTAAVEFQLKGKTYYGFMARSIGFEQMDIYVVIDETGAIAKLDAKQYIFEEEYFSAFGGMDVSAYRNGFVGLTSETFTGDQAVIATATMSSNAMKQAVNDAFASFDTLTKGGAQ